MPDKPFNGEVLHGTDIVACDALAYLSGVNYGSVVKVLAAVDALYRYTGAPVSAIASIDAAPTMALQVKDPAHKPRVKATDRLVRDLINRGFADRHQELLKLSERFPA